MAISEPRLFQEAVTKYLSEQEVKQLKNYTIISIVHTNPFLSCPNRNVGKYNWRRRNKPQLVTHITYWRIFISLTIGMTHTADPTAATKCNDLCMIPMVKLHFQPTSKFTEVYKINLLDLLRWELNPGPLSLKSKTEHANVTFEFRPTDMTEDFLVRSITNCTL